MARAEIFRRRGVLKDMVKKEKAKTSGPSAARPAEKTGAGKKRAAKPKKSASGKKRAGAQLALFLQVSRARKLAGDLYQSASLAIWAEAMESANPGERDSLIQLQDSICDAADLLKQARSANPRKLHLYWVASFDREGLPASPPRFVTAASEAEALNLFKARFKDEIGRRKPRAALVPNMADEPELHV